MKQVTKEFSTSAEIFFLASLFLLYGIWSVNPEILLLLTSAYSVIYLSAVLKFNTAGPFLTGLFLSLSYLSFYGDFYHYNGQTSHILNYPLYPLLAWPLSLTLLSYYMSMLFDVLSLKKTATKIAVAYGVYVVLLLFLEYSAYHYHHFHLTSNYAPLPFIDCLHTPPVMQVIYFMNGLLFFTVYFLLEKKRRYPIPELQ